ncbi:MAG: hypothetical protein ACOVSI_12940 [Gemmatimonas sp.]
MSAVLTFLTSRKTTFLAALTGAILLFFDASFIATLHEIGVSDAITAKMVSAAKLATLLLAALGYSPLRKPETTPTPTTEAP